MIIQSVHVQNFRSIADQTLHCDRLTALVGANGAGKSAFLRALDLFYAASLRLSIDDFYNRDTSREIVVGVTFTGLSAEAREQFSKYLQGDTLTIERVIRWSEGRITPKYHGSRLQNPAFSSVRDATSAADKKSAYDLIRTEPDYHDLPVWRSQAQGLQALTQWEEGHPERLIRQRDDGQFFGFTEVGQGYLGKHTRLLFIPAVRDALLDAEERRGSIFTDLMDLVVRSVLASKEEVLKLKEETQQRYAEILDPSQLTEISTLAQRLTTTLQTFAPGSEVQLIWQALGQVDIPLPKADVKLVEDEYSSSVDRTGHGLQRAFIITMLQHLALAQNPSNTQDEHDGQSRAVRNRSRLDWDSCGKYSMGEIACCA